MYGVQEFYFFIYYVVIHHFMVKIEQNYMKIYNIRMYIKFIYTQLIFDRRHWNNVSEESKDLIKKMLNKNPNIRPSAKDCLRHAYFRRKFANPVKLVRGRSTIVSMKSP